MIEQGVEVDAGARDLGGTGVLRDVRAPFQLPIASLLSVPPRLSPTPSLSLSFSLSLSLSLSLYLVSSTPRWDKQIR
jgi:hypothetical protein